LGIAKARALIGPAAGALFRLNRTYQPFRIEGTARIRMERLIENWRLGVDLNAFK
jgi:hypothetical protein